jgi:hypothetical protein
MKKIFVAVLLTLAPTLAFAGSLTYNLRDPSIEAIDEVNSFSLTLDGLTATLWAVPTSYAGNDVVLNQTSSSFGVNVNGTTCGGLEDSATIDGGCVGEAVKIAFNSDVFVNSLGISNFGSTDAGVATIGALSYLITSTGLQSYGSAFLAAGDSLLVAAGNGFSLDNFTVTASALRTAGPVATPEPSTLLLLAIGAGGMIRGRRWMRTR